MFNWNAQIRGAAGYPMQPQQMMGFPGSHVPLPGQQMSFSAPPPTWPPQAGMHQAMPGGQGMMMGQVWPPQTQPAVFAPAGVAPGPMAIPVAGMMGAMAPQPPVEPPPEERPPLPAEPPPPLPSTPTEKPQPPPPPHEQPQPPPPETSPATTKSSKWDQTSKPRSDAPSRPGGMMPQGGTLGSGLNQPPPPRGPPPLSLSPSQPMPPGGPPPSQAPPPQPPPTEKPQPDPQVLAELEKVKYEESMFSEQYKQWKKQYDDWREQNQNHPNKDQFEQYLDQWKTYEQQMEARRKSIETQKRILEEKLDQPAPASSEEATPNARWLSSFVQSYQKDQPPPQPQNDSSPMAWTQDSQNNPAMSQNLNVAQPHRPGGPQTFNRNSMERDPSKLGNFNPQTNVGGASQMNPFAENTGTMRGRGPSPAVPLGGGGNLVEEQGEEDMNLDDEGESEGGAIIEGGTQMERNNWQNQPPPALYNQSGDWNSWNPGPESQGPAGQGQWNNQGDNYGGFPGAGPHFPGDRGRGWFNQRGGPRGFRGGPDNFRGRGRGDWNSGNMDAGPRFGPGGAGMNQGPPFPGPVADNEIEQGNEYGEENWEQEDVYSYEDQAEQMGDNYQDNQYDYPGGRGRGMERGRGQYFGGRGELPQGRGGEFNRGWGSDFQRGRGGVLNRGQGGEFQRGRGSEFQRGRGEFQRGRGGEFQRGRGGEFERGRGVDFQRGRGSDFQRGRGVEFERGRGGEFQRGRGFPPRGRGRGQPPSLFSFEFDDNMKEKFADFDPSENEGEEEEQFAEDVAADTGEEYEENDGFGYGERGRGRGQGGMRGRGAGGYQDFHQDMTGHEEAGGFAHRGRGGSDWGRRGMERGRGMGDRGRGNFDAGRGGFERGRGFDRGRGNFRGRGGFGLVQETGDANTEYEEDYTFNARGRGGMRGRGGRGGFSNPDSSEQEYDDSYNAGFDQRGRGRGAMRGGRGRAAFNNDTHNTNEFGNDGPEFQHEDSYGPPRGGVGARGRDQMRGRGRGAGPGQVNYNQPWDSQKGPEWGNQPEREAMGEQFTDDLNQQEVPGAGYSSQNIDGRGGFGGGRGRGRGRGAVPDEDEPELKRPRLAADNGAEEERLPPPPPPFPRDPYDPYVDRFGDPYRDPRDRFYRDPYYDPYAPLPPYGYDRPMYDRYDPLTPRYDPLPERKPFVPAESIDYGHGGVATEKKAAQPAEVIDYGHGQVSENTPAGDRDKAAHSGLSEREQELADRIRQRAYGDSGRGDSDWSAARDDQSSKRRSRFEPKPEEEDFDLRRSGGARELDALARVLALARDELVNQKNLQGSTDRPAAESGRSGYSARRGEEDDIDMRQDRDRYGDRDLEPSRSRDRQSGSRYGEDKNFGASRYDSRDDDRRNRDREQGMDSGRSFSSRRDDRLRESESSRVRGDDRDYYRRDDEPYSRREDQYSNRSDDLYRGRSGDIQRSRGDAGGEEDYYRDRHRDGFGGLSRDRFGGYGGDAFRDGQDKGYRGDRDRYGRPLSPPARGTPPPPRPPVPDLSSQTKAETVKIEDLLCPPARANRPPHLVTIIRGLPGSGKTYVSKLIREKEISNGGGAPRMLCLDDYFMVEVDKEVVDPDTGKKVKRKMMEYEYEQALEEAYRQSLLKSFKKTVDDGFFPFIILDATNEKVAHFSEFWSYAKSKGFQVYVGELKADVATCIQRNIHHWTEWDIEKVKTNWEPLPNHYIRLDLRWLLQEDSIPEVVMEDTQPEEEEEEEEKKDEEEEEDESSGLAGIYKKSRWELDTSEETLDKLDGIRVSKKHIAEHQSLNDYLQLDQMDDDYFSRESVPGKKRVRWADLEEKKHQSRRRDLGFIVGQTQQDWDRITDDDFASKALNQTKYFYKN